MQVLTPQERDRLIIAALKSRPHTEGELQEIHDWACRSRIENAVLEMVLSGDLAPYIDYNEDPKDRPVHFEVAGREHAGEVPKPRLVESHNEHRGLQ
jgi:hypothetical protein